MERNRRNRKNARVIISKVLLVALLVFMVWEIGFFTGISSPESREGNMTVSENFGVFVTEDPEEFLDCLELIGFAEYPITDISISTTVVWGRKVTTYAVTYEVFEGFDFESEEDDNSTEEDEPWLALVIFLKLVYLNHIKFR